MTLLQRAGRRFLSKGHQHPSIPAVAAANHILEIALAAKLDTPLLQLQRLAQLANTACLNELGTPLIQNAESVLPAPSTGWTSIHTTFRRNGISPIRSFGLHPLARVEFWAKITDAQLQILRRIVASSNSHLSLPISAT